MAGWVKTTGREELLVGKDWALDMDGASIVAVADPIVPNGVTFTVEKTIPQGTIARYWLRGGAKGETAQVTIGVTTSEGEALDELVTVTIR